MLHEISHHYHVTMTVDVAVLLVALLWLYWILATGAAALSLLPGRFLSAFRSAVVLSACRGKLWDERPKAPLGMLTGWSVPQQWFAHFYMVGTSSNAVILYYLLQGDPDQAPCRGMSLLVAAMLQFHLLRRLLETLVVMRYPPDANMHGIAYLFGLSYYVLLSLSVLPTAEQRGVLDSVAAALRVHVLLPRQTQWQDLRRPQELCSLDSRVVLGISVFALGQLLQFHSHAILGGIQRRLAQSSSQAKGSKQYIIPRGVAFDYVSCPHYLGEITIYAGLAIACGPLQPLLFVILTWVVVNLILAADRTQQWYKNHFPAYPPHRKALFPCIW